MKSSSSIFNEYIAIPYPSHLQKTVEQTASLWKSFCSLPQKDKDIFLYSNTGTGIGYELKDGSGNMGDKKENFDVTGNPNLDLSQAHPVARDFVEHAKSLVLNIEPIALEYLRKVEETTGVTGLVEQIAGNPDAFFVRFIHYFEDQEIGTQTAHAHTDQSGFTLHLFESHAGLEYLSYENKEWLPMPVSKEETVIIPSMQMQNATRGSLTASCHRVVATNTTKKTGRYSAVCFVQLPHSPKYNKKEFGRLQEMEAGFNYGMGHAEFSKFFK